MLKPIIFWGASGQARVLREFVCRTHDLIALFDNDSKKVAPFPDVPLHYGKESFLHWRAVHAGTDIAFLIAIGGPRGRERLNLQSFMESHGLIAINAIHPRAFVAGSVSLGRGCQVLANASVCADVRMGDACLVNTGAIIDHECVLADGVHIGPGAVLTGCVNVGRGSMVGAGAVVVPRVNIGENVLVGAGGVVTRDVPNNQIVYGNPAKVVRANT